jgi:hypothetical protein
MSRVDVSRVDMSRVETSLPSLQLLPTYIAKPAPH